MSTAETDVVSAAELASLFSDLDRFSSLVLAVSGGPDSTALMLLAARWRAARADGPRLVAVTVDHGLRPEARREAAAVAKLARRLGIIHRTLRWEGRKPKTGLQEAARAARYRLLAAAARKAGAGAVLTAHTRDDQAETVLFRMSRASGLTGLRGMRRSTVLSLPDKGRAKEPLALVRPLLDVPKARLIATLKAAKVPFAEDPSNRDPRFTRARLRALMPALAAEGLDARRLALLARRIDRAEAALEAAVDEAEALLVEPAPARAQKAAIAIDTGDFTRLPAEIALRLLGRAIARAGDEGPVELGKLERLAADMTHAAEAGTARLRRSLAGAIVTIAGPRILVERAPRRRSRP